MSDEIREFLAKMAAEIEPKPVAPRETIRRARRKRARTATVGALVVSLMAYGGFAGVRALTRSTVPGPIASTLGHQPQVEECSWTVVPTPNQDLTKYFNHIDSVEVVSDDDVWATATYYVGQEGGFSAQSMLHWDGSDWVTLPLPTVGTDFHISDLAAVSPEDVWAVGSFDDESGGANVLSLHWDGAEWANVPAPNSDKRFNLLTGVDALSANDVWAVGAWATGEVGGTLIEHWGGKAWTIVPSPDKAPDPVVGASYSRLNAVTALAADDVWAVGSAENVAPAGPSNALIEHWDGTAWTIVASPDVPAESGDPYDHLYSIEAASPSDLWAVGDYGTKVQDFTALPEHTLIEHWDGNGWSVASSPLLEGRNSLSALAVVSPDEVWAVGSYWQNDKQNALIELWDGSSWTQIESPVSGASLNGAGVSPTGQVWAVGLVQTGPETVQTLALRCGRAG
jgi:hypothetical protein